MILLTFILLVFVSGADVRAEGRGGEVDSFLGSPKGEGENFSYKCSQGEYREYFSRGGNLSMERENLRRSIHGTLPGATPTKPPEAALTKPPEAALTKLTK